MHTVQLSALGYLFFQVSTSNLGVVSALKATSSSLNSLDPRSSWSSSNHPDVTPLEKRTETNDMLSTQSGLPRAKARRSSFGSKTFHSRSSKNPKRRNLDKIKANLLGLHALGGKVGDATFYGTGLGACGKVSTDESMIAAVSHLLFDHFPGAGGNPNENPVCGRKVKATYKGASVVVEVVDRCEACSIFDLDFSPAAFSKLGSQDEGRLHGMRWEWL